MERLPCQELDVQTGCQFERLEVDLEDLLALVQIRQVDVDLTVETSGAQERLVQDVGAVGGSQHDDIGIGLEPVHLGEELVEGIFPLVVRAGYRVLATGTPDGVNLVDKDNGGRLFLGLLEQVAHAGSPHPDEHFDEVRTRKGEERHARFSGDRLGQKGLTRSGRAYQQGSFGDFSTQAGVLGGFAQEIDDLLQLFLGPFQSGYVLEGNPDPVVLVEHPGLALADVEDLIATTAATAGHTAEHPDEEHNHQDHRKPREQVAPERIGFFHPQRNVEPVGIGYLIEGFLEIGRIDKPHHELRAGGSALPVSLGQILVLVGFQCLGGQINVGDFLVVDHHLLHLARGKHRVEKFVPRDVLGTGLVAIKIFNPEDHDDDQGRNPPESQRGASYGRNMAGRFFLFHVCFFPSSGSG